MNLQEDRRGASAWGLRFAVLGFALFALVSEKAGLAQTATPDDALPQNPDSIKGAPAGASTPEMIEATPEQASPVLIVPKLQLAPPVYVDPILPPLSQPGEGLSAAPKIFVSGFRFEGNSVFSSGTLNDLIKQYAGREVTADELEEARQTLTLYYVNHGYINSGAILPEQDLKEGIVRIQIVEGKLTAVKVHGNKWFQTWWLRNRVRQAAGSPLNFNDLKQGLQLMRENPMVAQVNAELRPGGAPGESYLDMEVKDTHPFRFSIEAVNNRPPSVGSEILWAHASDLSLTGNNDTLNLDYGIVQSNNNGFEFSDWRNIDANYTAPISPWGTTLQVRASKSDSSLIQQPFNVLNIDSTLEQYGATIRQPIIETPARQFALAFSVDDRRLSNKVFDIPFSISAGEINGVEDVFAIRFIQEYIERSQTQVFSTRSAFSAGLNAFGATINAHSPDGHFYTWLGQSQYIRRLGNSDNLLVLRLNAQLADRPLLSLEQFELGGSSNVRGYLENQEFRDNGVFGSAEVRFPVLKGKDRNPILAIAPFADIGAAWNSTDTYEDGNGSGLTPHVGSEAVGLPSVGVGLLFNPNKYVAAQVYWGYALNQHELPEGHNLQNYGISFDVTVSAF